MFDLIIRVLEEYDIRQPDAVTSFEEGYGFSGSRIWRVEHGSLCYCLKRWPAGKPSRETQDLIARVVPEIDRQGLPVATPLNTRRGERFCSFEGRTWELSYWLTGAPVGRNPVSDAQLQNAIQWLARYHQIACEIESRQGRSQALTYRYQLAQQLAERTLRELRDYTYPMLDSGLASLFVTQAEKMLPPLIGALQKFESRSWSLLPAISDLWSDHMFFEGDKVSGVIDFGAMKLDSPCLDIARLLGSFQGFCDTAMTRGLEMYQAARRLEPAEIELIELFDRVYVVLAGVQWLIWLGPDRREFGQNEKVNQRLIELARRVP